jgi:plasmid maintenance system antidote protein VapI
MSFQISIPPNRHVAARFIENVRRSLLKGLMETKVTQSDIARALGVNRSVIHRELKGYQDITMGRAAEIAWAIGKKAVFAIEDQRVFEDAKEDTEQLGAIDNPLGSNLIAELDYFVNKSEQAEFDALPAAVATAELLSKQVITSSGFDSGVADTMALMNAISNTGVIDITPYLQRRRSPATSQPIPDDEEANRQLILLELETVVAHA